MANSLMDATQPRWANGMAGSAGTSWYGSAGLVSVASSYTFKQTEVHLM